MLSLSVFPADMECRSVVMGLFGKPKRYSLGLSQKDMDALLERVENHFGGDFLGQSPESLSDEQLHKLMDLTGSFLEQRDATRGLLARPSSFTRNFFESTLPRRITEFSRLMSVIWYRFIPHRTILNREEMRIVGQWGTSRELAERVARTIERFDEDAKAWGLRIPEFTKILLIDKPFWPRGGPAFHPAPILDFSRWKAGMMMEFTPLWSKVREDLDPSTIMHERSHNLLFEDFNRLAVINKETIFAEALADFLSSHVRGDPHTYIRNIETMESEGIGIHSIEHLNDDDYSDHAKSLIFSNLLWRLREKIDREGISQIFLPFITKLNIYEEKIRVNNLSSFDKYMLDKEGNLDKKEKMMDTLAENFPVTKDMASLYTYFAAVLLKTASEEGYADEVAQVVRESSERLSFDSRKIFSLSEQLRASTKEWKRGPTTIREAVKLTVATATIAGFTGWSFTAIVWLMFEAFSFL